MGEVENLCTIYLQNFAYSFPYANMEHARDNDWINPNLISVNIIYVSEWKK